MRKTILTASVVGLTLLATGCAPSTFVRTTEPTWASVELRKDVTFEKAWASVVDTLIKNGFQIEVLSKENGYLRTGWLYSWTGEMMENYRVRVTVKFKDDNTLCDVKSEAEYGGSRGWVMGYDSRLLSTVKTDVMGKIAAQAP